MERAIPRKFNVSEGYAVRRLRLLLSLTLLAAACTAAPAPAAGYWNVPSNFCQCMGHGCGAGYHAPLVLGPVSCSGWLDRNEIRLPYAPRPHYGHGSGNCSDSFHGPSMLEPASFVPAGAQFTPTPAAHHAPLRR